MSIAALAPVVTVLVLLELSVGATVVVYLGDLSRDAGRGFAGTTALILLGVMAVDLVILAVLPEPGSLIHRPVDAGEFASFVHWTVAFTAGLALYALFCAVGTDPARRVVGAVPVVAGVMAVVRAASAFGSPLLGGRGGLVALIPAALLAGSALAGMLLGHWYLISPDLSFRPLRRIVLLIFVTIGLQAATIVMALLVAGPAARQQVLTDVSFWLLVVATGVLATAGINGLTYYFARIRANQPATAMLYVLIVSSLMGVIPAHLLYFSTQVPV
jgi:hypothetical protein